MRRRFVEDYTTETYAQCPSKAIGFPARKEGEAFS